MVKRVRSKTVAQRPAPQAAPKPAAKAKQPPTTAAPKPTRPVIRSEDKPHHGRMIRWHRIPIPDYRKQAQGYFVVGFQLDHPGGPGWSHTAEAFRYDERTGELETLTERFTLVEKLKPGEPIPPGLLAPQPDMSAV